MQLLVFIDKRIFFKQEHRRRNNTNFFQGYTRYTKSSRPEISKYRKPTSNGYRSRSLFKWTGSNKYGYFNLQVDIIFYIFLYSTYIPKFVNLGGKNDSEAVQPDVASGSGRLFFIVSGRNWIPGLSNWYSTNKNQKVYPVPHQGRDRCK